MLSQLEQQPALIDQVHDRLVAAIVDGTLAPGQRITQESVAEMLGVSRQPVSHALQILKRRGLLVEHGKRSLAVLPMDGTMVRDLYQVREVLDGLAAGLAASGFKSGRLGAAARAELGELVTRGQSLSPSCDKTEWVAADVAFHSGLYRLSGNPQIAATVAEQWPHFMRSMGLVLASDDVRLRVWDEHAAIADAILAGDAGQASALARGHAARVGVATANLIQELEPTA